MAETEFNVAKANAKREKAILSTLMSEEVDTNLGESDSTTEADKAKDDQADETQAEETQAEADKAEADNAAADKAEDNAEDKAAADKEKKAADDKAAADKKAAASMKAEFEKAAAAEKAAADKAQRVVVMSDITKEVLQLDLMKAAEDAENEFSPVVETFIKGPAEPTRVSKAGVVGRHKPTTPAPIKNVIDPKAAAALAEAAVAEARTAANELSAKSLSASALTVAADEAAVEATQKSAQEVEKDGTKLVRETTEKEKNITEKTKKIMEAARAKSKAALEQSRAFEEESAQKKKMIEPTPKKAGPTADAKAIAAEKTKALQAAAVEAQQADLLAAKEEREAEAKMAAASGAPQDQARNLLIATKELEAKADRKAEQTLAARGVKVAMKETAAYRREVELAKLKLTEVLDLQNHFKQKVLKATAMLASASTKTIEVGFKKTVDNAKAALLLAENDVTSAMNTLREKEDKLAKSKKIEMLAAIAPPPIVKDVSLEIDIKVAAQKRKMEKEFVVKSTKIIYQENALVYKVTKMRQDAFVARNAAKKIFDDAQTAANVLGKTRGSADPETIKREVDAADAEQTKQNAALEAERAQLDIDSKQTGSILEQREAEEKKRVESLADESRQAIIVARKAQQTADALKMQMKIADDQVEQSEKLRSDPATMLSKANKVVKETEEQGMRDAKVVSELRVKIRSAKMTGASTEKLETDLKGHRQKVTQLILKLSEAEEQRDLAKAIKAAKDEVDALEAAKEKKKNADQAEIEFQQKMDAKAKAHTASAFEMNVAHLKEDLTAAREHADFLHATLLEKIAVEKTNGNAKNKVDVAEEELASEKANKRVGKLSHTVVVEVNDLKIEKNVETKETNQKLKRKEAEQNQAATNMEIAAQRVVHADRETTQETMEVFNDKVKLAKSGLEKASMRIKALAAPALPQTNNPQEAQRAVAIANAFDQIQTAKANVEIIKAAAEVKIATASLEALKDVEKGKIKHSDLGKAVALTRKTVSVNSIESMKKELALQSEATVTLQTNHTEEVAYYMSVRASLSNAEEQAKSAARENAASKTAVEEAAQGVKSAETKEDATAAKNRLKDAKASADEVERRADKAVALEKSSNSTVASVLKVLERFSELGSKASQFVTETLKEKAQFEVAMPEAKAEALEEKAVQAAQEAKQLQINAKFLAAQTQKAAAVAKLMKNGMNRNQAASAVDEILMESKVHTP